MDMRILDEWQKTVAEPTIRLLGILKVVVGISLYYDDFDEVRMGMINSYLKSKKDELDILDVDLKEITQLISDHWYNGNWI